MSLPYGFVDLFCAVLNYLFWRILREVYINNGRTDKMQSRHTQTSPLDVIMASIVPWRKHEGSTDALARTTCSTNLCQSQRRMIPRGTTILVRPLRALRDKNSFKLK